MLTMLDVIYQYCPDLDADEFRMLKRLLKPKEGRHNGFPAYAVVDVEAALREIADKVWFVED